MRQTPVNQPHHHRSERLRQYPKVKHNTSSSAISPLRRCISINRHGLNLTFARNMNFVLPLTRRWVNTYATSTHDVISQGRAERVFHSVHASLPALTVSFEYPQAAAVTIMATRKQKNKRTSLEQRTFPKQSSPDHITMY